MSLQQPRPYVYGFREGAGQGSFSTAPGAFSLLEEVPPLCINSGRATNRATAPGVWIPKMWGRKGAIDGTHRSSGILLKNDQYNKHEFHFGKRQL